MDQTSFNQGINILMRRQLLKSTQNTTIIQDFSDFLYALRNTYILILGDPPFHKSFPLFEGMDYHETLSSAHMIILEPSFLWLSGQVKKGESLVYLSFPNSWAQ